MGRSKVAATQADWSDAARDADCHALLRTRANGHLVMMKMPGGERQQLTFFEDAVGVMEIHQNGGDYIVFRKMWGGGRGRVVKLYRMEPPTCRARCL